MTPSPKHPISADADGRLNPAHKPIIALPGYVLAVPDTMEAGAGQDVEWTGSPGNTETETQRAFDDADEKRGGVAGPGSI